MVFPDALRGLRGKADLVDDCAIAPGLADAEAVHVAHAHIGDHLRRRDDDGFSVGEPWNNRAIVDKIGFTAETTQAIWKDHPEKTLGTTAEWVQKNPNTARAMTAAIIDAGRWIDASLSNRQKTAETVADKGAVDGPSLAKVMAKEKREYTFEIGRAHV